MKLVTGAAAAVLLMGYLGPTAALADTIEAALVRAYQNNPQLNAQRAQVRDLFGPPGDGDMVEALAIVGNEGRADLDDQALCLLDDGIHERVGSGRVGIIKGAIGALCEMSMQPSR